MIKRAINRELNRDGQVYFVHNRVYDIHDDRRSHPSGSSPRPGSSWLTARCRARQLERAMMAFVRHEADVLVATTIIESGVDIPNVNTIFIHEADRYGLADLHQLRGRVGRFKHRAYAYLIIESTSRSPRTR